MADVVSKSKRSEMMSAIRHSNTDIEVQLRRRLHRLGFRYRLHQASLPGKPDLVFPRFEAVIFVNGCFWHRHDCELFRLPKSNTGFWQAKMKRNRERDHENIAELQERGWRVLTVWECAVRGEGSSPWDVVADQAAAWLLEGDAESAIRATG